MKNQKLISFEERVKELGYTVEDAEKLLSEFKASPAADFYNALLIANEYLIKQVKNEEFDLDEPYDKAVFELLKTGEKIPKLFTMAKAEAFPSLTKMQSAPEVETPIGGSMLDEMVTNEKA